MKGMGGEYGRNIEGDKIRSGQRKLRGGDENAKKKKNP
jgi:hypothetical protein